MFKKIFKSEFLKNVLTLMTGTGIAQAVPILISPILTRMYSPDQFGMFALFMSIAGSIAIISSLRYEIAIMLPENDRDSVNVVSLSFIIILFISILTLIGVFIINLVSDNFWGASSEMKLWLYIMPLFVLLQGITQTINNWFVRKKDYKFIAIGKVNFSLVTNIFLIIFGIWGFTNSGIFISNLLGWLVFSLFFIFKLFKKYGHAKSQVNKFSIKRVAKEYKEFPTTNVFQALIESFQMSGIIILVSYYFSTYVSGLYSFSLRVLMAPMWIIGSSIAQVFYQKASETYNNKGDLRLLIRKTVFNSALFFTPVLLVLLISGPSIFAFIFGDKWRIAGEFARILSPWIFLDFVKSPISQVPLIVGKIKTMLPITIIGIIILLFSLIWGGIVKDIYFGFMLLSGLMCLYVLCLMAWIYKVAAIKK
ncbi:MAG: oligosaccharide flippase family protein [Bacteroidetes bacterium]|nr:oligosaccharide flippase family protein [Bacteroidota bacterium]